MSVVSDVGQTLTSGVGNVCQVWEAVVSNVGHILTAEVSDVG